MFESEDSFAHMLLILLVYCDYLPHSKFRIYQIEFQLNTDFPSQFCVFLAQNHLTLLKDRLLKKMVLKRANTRRLFIIKTIDLNHSFTLIENNSGF